MKGEFVIKFILLSLLIFSLIYVSGIINIRIHEDVHKIIYGGYNIKSRIEIDYLRVGGFTITNDSNVSEKCNDSCKMQHNFNDIVGYNMTTLTFSIWFIFFCFIFYKLLFERKND